MKSRTSFSNLTTFKKDITRFAPVWVLYLIGVLMVLTNSLGYDSYDRVGSDMGNVIMVFSVVNLVYAGVIAMTIFGDLYNTRMCYSLHTLPQRRETLLLSHICAALLFSLVPNILAALYMMLRLESYWFLALYWLLAAELQFLFFLGVATVSALLVGNRFALLAVYAVLNFFSMIIYWVLNTIYLPMLTGVVMDFNIFSKLCPVVDLCSSWEFFSFDRVQTQVFDPYYNEYYTDTFYKYVGLGTGWGYTAILAAIGLVLMGVGVLLYRKRHLESAGDFVAFRKLSPVICVVLTICVGVGFAFVGDAMLGGSYGPWLIVGLIVGYFGSLMLLERRVKVFRVKTFLGFGVLAVALTLSFLAIAFDVFHIESFVPNPDQVQSVTLSNYRATYYSYDYYGNRINVELEDQEDIENVIAAHQDILDRLEEDTKSTYRVTFTYKLKSGRIVKRSYSAPAYGTNYEIIRKYFFTPQQILGYTDWETYVSHVQYLYIDGCEFLLEDYRPILEALRADCEAGNVSTDQIKAEDGHWVELQISEGSLIVYRNLWISPDAEHFAALLKDPAFFMGAGSADELLAGLNWIYVDGRELDAHQAAELIEALYADCKNGTIALGYGTPGKFHVEYHACGNYRILMVTEEAENTLNWYYDNIG